MARYEGRKLRDMKRRLEGSNVRQWAGVFAELLVSEILCAVAARAVVEPRIGRVSPDFRIFDAAGESAVIEVTHFMDSSDEIHSEARIWNSLVSQLRAVVEPVAVHVIAHPVGRPRCIDLTECHGERIREMVLQSSICGTTKTLRLSEEFSVAFRARPKPGGGEIGWLDALDYEHPGGVVDMEGKFQRIVKIVGAKAEKYSECPEPLVVVVNCPTAFLWLDQKELAPLSRMLRTTRPPEAVWLFENLQPWSLGCCRSHLIESPSHGHSTYLDMLRRAQVGPLHEVLGLGPSWNRYVGFDR